MRQIVQKSVLLLALLLGACGAPAAAVPTIPAATAPAATAVATVEATAAATAATTAPAATAESTPAEATAAALQGTQVLTDSLGRTVELPAAPQRIISLAPSNTEILFAVGAGPQVVGVTQFCNYPAEATKLPQVGGFSAKTISVETIVSLKPDVVFAGDESQQQVIEALEQVKIPVVAVKASTLDEVYQNIALVGQATGHSADAATVVADMQAKAAGVVAKLKDVDAKPKVFYQVYDEPLMTAGPRTFIGQLVELAGGQNIFADAQDDYPQISAEEVVSRNPEVVLGPESSSSTLTVEQITQRPGWQNIAAVKDGRVVLVNDDIVSRPGPRLVDALEAIAKALHPDLFQ
ncbi:ABC transporter substrate-binding protein [Chloroflexia bacterium SDU3-3]|nr:ABC transporter substrate-binding protein [Chloroflexia bacterium SDU3-3]